MIGEARRLRIPENFRGPGSRVPGGRALRLRVRTSKLLKFRRFRAAAAPRQRRGGRGMCADFVRRLTALPSSASLALVLLFGRFCFCTSFRILRGLSRRD